MKHDIFCCCSWESGVALNLFFRQKKNKTHLRRSFSFLSQSSVALSVEMEVVRAGIRLGCVFAGLYTGLFIVIIITIEFVWHQFAFVVRWNGQRSCPLPSTLAIARFFSVR